MSSAKHVEIAWRHGEGSGEGFALASRSSATPTMRTRHPVASYARARTRRSPSENSLIPRRAGVNLVAL